MSTMEERMVTDLPNGGTEILNLVLFRSTNNSYYKSVDQESSLFLTMDSQTSSPVGPAA